MQNVYKAWQESLAVFGRQQWYKTAFAFGKNILTVYKQLIFSLWWSLAVVFGAWYYTAYVDVYSRPALLVAAMSLYCALLVLASRASTRQKTMQYYSSYMVSLVVLVLASLALLPVYAWPMYSLLACYCFFLLFLFDAGGHAQEIVMSPIRAIYLIVRTLPVQLILAGLFLSAAWLPMWLAIPLVFPVCTSVCTVLYTIWIHTDYATYYSG